MSENTLILGCELVNGEPYLLIAPRLGDGGNWFKLDPKLNINNVRKEIKKIVESDKSLNLGIVNNAKNWERE